MSYLIFWALGFGTIWAGLNLFDDEIFLISTLFAGSGLVIAGLFSCPEHLRFVIEVALIVSVFYVCTECIERGDQP